MDLDQDSRHEALAALVAKLKEADARAEALIAEIIALADRLEPGNGSEFVLQAAGVVGWAEQLRHDGLVQLLARAERINATHVRVAGSGFQRGGVVGGWCRSGCSPRRSPFGLPGT
jgi:hypothetical protein